MCILHFGHGSFSQSYFPLMKFLVKEQFLGKELGRGGDGGGCYLLTLVTALVVDFCLILLL